VKALSVRRPWAYIILAGIPLYEAVDLGEGKSTVRYSGKNLFKNIENRSRRLPKSFELPQRVYIHVSQHDEPLTEAMMGFMFRRLSISPIGFMTMYCDVCRRGVLAGEVTITEQVTKSDNPWFTGPYGYVLADPLLFEKPIPYRGKLGFFEVGVQDGKLFESIQRR
jgi:hypothetical protein